MRQIRLATAIQFWQIPGTLHSDSVLGLVAKSKNDAILNLLGHVVLQFCENACGAGYNPGDGEPRQEVLSAPY